MNAPDPALNAAVNALRRYEILHTAAEATFDDLARRAADIFGVAFAGISFFDLADDAAGAGARNHADHAGLAGEWFKSVIGLPQQTLARQDSFFAPFAAGALAAPFDNRAARRTMVIHDALADKRVREHRWVVSTPHICFYAGALILSREQAPIGLIAVFDSAARESRPREMEALVNLADLVTARLEARAEARRGRREAASPMGAARSHNHADENQAVLAREYLQMEQLLENEVALRQEAEMRLRHEKEFSEAAIGSLPGAFFMFDKNGMMVRWNRRFLTNTAYNDDEIGRRRAVDFIAPHDRALVADAIRRVIERGDEVTLEADMLSKDGLEAPYLFHGSALDIGGQRYCIGAGRDITERRRTEREITDAKERLDLALAGSNLALWDWDLAANEVFFSDGWATMLGVQREGTEGVRFRGEQVISLTHPGDRSKFEAELTGAVRGISNEFSCDYRVPGEDGGWIWLHAAGKVTERDGRGHVRRMTGTTSNITARKIAEERVEFLATCDALTGLPNRMLLNDRLELGLANAARKATRLAFMFIDLDRFKTINDSLGHDVGDELLKRVAARLSACVRGSDTVARLGGDEFAIILENLPNDGQEAQSVAEKMITSLAAPMQIGEHQLNTSCSLGISVFPTDGQDAQTLMKHADVAMYDAKARGRNNYQFFSRAMNAKAQQRLSIENFLRLALRRNELSLHYQPRVGFSTGEVTGVEALIRWHHPKLGLMLPDQFISVAEDSGLIVPIGEWVVEEAFRQVAEWQKKSGRNFAVAVNLSAGQMLDPKRLVASIAGALKKSGLDARDVVIELTEGMLLKNTDEGAAALKQMGVLGIGIAVDNFGTGFSSLAYLKQLPIDSIKVDSSFVHDIGADHNDEAIVRAIIAMTHSLKLNVVAEGVESEQQYRVLRDLGCDEYQGYYFSKPLPPEEFEAQFLDRV